MNSTLFNPLEYPACLEFPLWLQETAWAEHLPFAMFLISALRPRVLVELGTYYGVSYCAFCQVVKSENTATKCYAVDTWQGDPHGGVYEQSVLSELRAHHDPLYADFSSLIRSTFDEALTHFADRSIDLLHIDGFHTYEAVRHDFESWLPKMSERGLAIFHDVNVREREFGVWKFWSEVKEKYPSFEFLHGHGLGVLAVGTQIPKAVDFLFEAPAPQTKLVRKLFHQLGSRIDAVRKSGLQENRIACLQLYEQTVLKSRPVRIYHYLTKNGINEYVKMHAKRYWENGGR